MKIRNEKSIATIYDAVSILKGLDIINGSLKQNYYAESALFVPDRFINPLILRPKIDISDPSGSIPNGDKVDELSRLEWFENGVKINSNDDFKIEGANLTVFKNSEEPFEISYRAEWFDSRKKQVITIEDSVVVSCISLAQSDANVTMSLSKPQNWVHNPLKGERIYTINAYVSKDKVHESAVEWYYVDSNKKDKLIDSSCSFYVEGQYTNALKVDSAYMDNVIIKAKNISNDKLKEVYWFFDKEGNPITYSEPDKTIIEGKDIFNLPESPITSKLDYRINGLTIEQLVDGDFSNGKITDYFKEYGPSPQTVITNKIDYIQIDTVYSYGGFINAGSGLNVQADDKVYLFAEAKQSKDARFYLYMAGIRGEENIKEDWGFHSYIATRNETSDNVSVGIRTRSFTEEQTANLEYETLQVRYFGVVNLTKTFGKGNEPSKEWCDEHIQGYFEGIKSVQTPMRVKSVGENLFSTKSAIPGNFTVTITDTGYIKDKNSAAGIKATLCLKPNTTYKAGYDYIGSVRSLLKDEATGETIQPLGQWNHLSFNSGSGKVLWSFSTTSTDMEIYTEVSNMYITSDSSLGYTPYTESNLYLNNNIELKSVGELKDYVENGKLYKKLSQTYKLKDLKSYYISSTNNAEYSKLGIHRFHIEKAGYYGNAKLNIYIQDLLYSEKNRNYLEEADKDSYYCRDAFYGHHQLAIHTELNKYKNVDELIEDYGDLDIFFQLKEEVINLSTSGSLTTYPNGTIFIDNAIQLEEQYQEGITIKEDYPIQVLESIKVGKEYLDASKAVVKDNLITHPDIANGDNVTIEYLYDENPIRNTNSIAYLVLEDILDEFWLDNVYTYKITDGEWELVKVTDIEDYEEWLKTEKTSPHTLAPDGVIFGSYEAETKFIRQYPSSLYVDIIAPTRLKEGITQIKARALVGTADGVIENPSKYFDISWYKKSNKAGASDVIIGEGEELTIDVADVDRIGIEVESKAIKE